MKIYVITAGEYSDYTIYGVTTDPMRAKRMQKIVGAYIRGPIRDVNIEEYEDGIFDDDVLNTVVPRECYRVSILYPEGKVIDNYKYLADKSKQIDIYERHCIMMSKRTGAVEYVVSNIRAENKKEAEKIAIDEIARYRVEKGELEQ